VTELGGRARSELIIFAINGRQLLPSAETEVAPSVLWFPSIQCIERKQDLAGLTPKDCFIPTEPVEGAAGQIGKTQKAARKVCGGIDRFPPGAGHDFRSFRSVCDAMRRPIAVAIDRVAEQRIDQRPRVRVNLAGLPEFT
jgi:hypothetical protein